MVGDSFWKFSIPIRQSVTNMASLMASDYDAKGKEAAISIVSVMQEALARVARADLCDFFILESHQKFSLQHAGNALQ